jgi:hypothetical protein
VTAAGYQAGFIFQCQCGIIRLRLLNRASSLAVGEHGERRPVKPQRWHLQAGRTPRPGALPGGLIHAGSAAPEPSSWMAVHPPRAPRQATPAALPALNACSCACSCAWPPWRNRCCSGVCRASSDWFSRCAAARWQRRGSGSSADTSRRPRPDKTGKERQMADSQSGSALPPMRGRPPLPPTVLTGRDQHDRDRPGAAGG